MKPYESPGMEIIELRPEERLAATYTKSGTGSYGLFEFTVTDNDLGKDDGILNKVMGSYQNSAGSMSDFFATNTTWTDLKRFFGF